ncbi:MAG: hypothetical protein EOP59_12400, partial [Sphingomonadales bacterium]
GALLTRGGEKADSATVADHAAPEGTSRQIWRAVAANTSTASIASRAARFAKSAFTGQRQACLDPRGAAAGDQSGADEAASLADGRIGIVGMRAIVLEHADRTHQPGAFAKFDPQIGIAPAGTDMGFDQRGDGIGLKHDRVRQMRDAAGGGVDHLNGPIKCGLRFEVQGKARLGAGGRSLRIGVGAGHGRRGGYRNRAGRARVGNECAVDEQQARAGQVDPQMRDIGRAGARRCRERVERRGVEPAPILRDRGVEDEAVGQAATCA